MDESSQLLKAVNEIRDLVRLMAEPAIAERDQKLRASLKLIVGSSAVKSKAVALMDGSRTQAVIHRETGMNAGHLSTLVKRLNEAKLVAGESKQPELAISIPPNFFENGDDRK